MLALFTITSCQKDGSEGPEGPQGAPGTANVIYSDWLDVEFTPETDDDTGDTLVYTASIPAPKLVDSILAKGEIKVYLNAGTAATPAIFPLPLTDLVYALTGIESMNLIFQKGNIILYSTQDASTATNQQGAKVYQYRYVLIPGGALAIKPDNLRLDNYRDVQKYLNLKD